MILNFITVCTIKEGYNQISYKWWNIWVVNKTIFLWFCYSVNLFFLLCSFIMNSRFSIFYNFTEIHLTVSIGFDFQSLVMYSEKDEKIGECINKWPASNNKCSCLSHKIVLHDRERARNWLPSMNRDIHDWHLSKINNVKCM